MENINIEIVGFIEDEIYHERFHLPFGSTIKEALSHANLLAKISKTMYVGIFSKILPLETTLKEGDRVEIYSPLNLTPMQRRILKARDKS